MFSPLQSAQKYFRYLLTASSGKGHGIHSPFVFDFITAVLNDTNKYSCYGRLEKIRRQMLSDKNEIDVEDFGAGSAVISSRRRVVKDIAASSLKPAKYAQLLFRMVRHYQPSTILELGTSLGVTAGYLASGNPSATVYTCEGSPAIAAIARENFIRAGIANIALTEGDFNRTLPLLLPELDKIGLVFIDGNHRKEPTVDYFLQLLAHAGPDTLFVFDDIHWSSGMEEAWHIIRQHDVVTLTIDLFFIGIVCINPGIKEKQHFVLRY